MTFRRLSTVATAALLAGSLAGCVVAPPRERRVVYDQPTQPVYSTQPSQPVYNQPGRPVPLYADYGRVENIGLVQISQRPSGAGALLGAVIGGVVGNRFGSGTGKALATGAGAIGGAVAGNAIEGRTRRDDEAYRVQVRFDSGAVRDFDYQRIDDLRIGDRVKLEGGELHRM